MAPSDWIRWELFDCPLSVCWFCKQTRCLAPYFLLPRQEEIQTGPVSRMNVTWKLVIPCLSDKTHPEITATENNVRGFWTRNGCQWTIEAVRAKPPTIVLSCSSSGIQTIPTPTAYLVDGWGCVYKLTTWDQEIYCPDNNKPLANDDGNWLSTYSVFGHLATAASVPCRLCFYGPSLIVVAIETND